MSHADTHMHTWIMLCLSFFFKRPTSKSLKDVQQIAQRCRPDVPTKRNAVPQSQLVAAMACFSTDMITGRDVDAPSIEANCDLLTLHSSRLPKSLRSAPWKRHNSDKVTGRPREVTQ